MIIIFSFCFWLHWVFTAARAFSSCGDQEASLCLRCVGFSLWVSLVVDHGCPVWGFSSCCSCLRSCGTWAQMWNLPGRGLEPVSPKLAGGFLSTGQLGKSSKCLLWTMHQANCWLDIKVFGFQCYSRAHIFFFVKP